MHKFNLRKSLPLITVSFLFCLFTSSYSQVITGRILDQDKTAIPFATVSAGEYYGVLSNEEGSFSIDLTDLNPQDSVSISSFGFEKQSYLIENFASRDYILKKQINTLSEVYLTNRELKIDSIVYYMEKNLRKNYKQSLSSYDFFSRKTEYTKGKTADFEIKKSTGFTKNQLSLFNNDFDELERLLISNKTKQYTDLKGVITLYNEDKAKLEVEKAIRLVDAKNDQSFESLFNKGNDIVFKHLDKSKVYTVKSGLFKISDSTVIDNQQEKMEDTVNSLGHVRKVTQTMLKDHVFLSDDPKLDFVSDTRKYEYNLVDVTFLGDELVYVVNFKPDSRSANYEGSLYISGDTFAVLRMSYGFAENKIGKKLNLKFLLGLKFAEKNNRGFAEYRKAEDGTYVPKYISESYDRYFYVDRPIKFIENENRRNKVSFNFLVEGNFREKTELLILDRMESSPSAYNAITEKEKIDYQTPEVYDASVWEGYDVLQPLNDMKAFKASTENEE